MPYLVNLVERILWLSVSRAICRSDRHPQCICRHWYYYIWRPKNPTYRWLWNGRCWIRIGPSIRYSAYFKNLNLHNYYPFKYHIYTWQCDRWSKQLKISDGSPLSNGVIWAYFKADRTLLCDRIIICTNTLVKKSKSTLHQFWRRANVHAVSCICMDLNVE